MKSKQVDPRRKIKRNILLLSLVVILAAVILVGYCLWVSGIIISNKQRPPQGSAETAAVCTMPAQLSCTERCYPLRAVYCLALPKR